MKIVGILEADPSRADHGKRKDMPKPQELYTQLTASQALKLWHGKNMQGWRPRPAVVLDTGEIPIMVDTNQPPWYRPVEALEELTDDQQKLFAAVTHGQFDNIVQIPGMFAGSPAAFICMIGPADPNKDLDMESMENVRFMPLYVQLTEATGPMVQQIGGAQLKVGDNPELRAKRAASPLAGDPSILREPKPSDIASISKPVPHAGHSGTPISTGTVLDMAQHRGKTK